MIGPLGLITNCISKLYLFSEPANNFNEASSLCPSGTELHNRVSAIIYPIINVLTYPIHISAPTLLSPVFRVKDRSETFQFYIQNTFYLIPKLNFTFGLNNNVHEIQFSFFDFNTC